MANPIDPSAPPDRTLAGACGLYCAACSLYLGTTEDPARLTRLARRFGMAEAEVACHGCRSAKRGPYCRTCAMIACTTRRGIDFCSQCGDYPCPELERFQAEAPHRIELWESLERIRSAGVGPWLAEARARHACGACGTINSAYDLACRSCGADPSCAYVARHRPAIEAHLRKVAGPDGRS